MSAFRAAIYARYSTELQSSASIQDQVRVCRKLCQENGWQVVEVFVDEAMSGERWFGCSEQVPGVF